ncbi:MAG: hypothetical protein OHK0023_20180 [Anaerolineae bacterium]
MFNLKQLAVTATDVTLNNPHAYDEGLAQYHTLLNRDWRATMQREGSSLRRLLREANAKTVLDAACGVGGAAAALAGLGFTVTAVCSNLKMLARAHATAASHRVQQKMTFALANITDIPTKLEGTFDAVLLRSGYLARCTSDAEIAQTLRMLHQKVVAGGSMVVSLPDFDTLLNDRPRFVPRHIHDEGERQHILFDTYDWQDTAPPTVVFSTFIVSGAGEEFTTKRFAITYRTLLRDEVEKALLAAGFSEVRAESAAWETTFVAKKA